MKKHAKTLRNILNGQAEAGCCHAASGDHSTEGAGEPSGKDLRCARAPWDSQRRQGPWEEVAEDARFE